MISGHVMSSTQSHSNGIRKTQSEGSICTIRMLISVDDREIHKLGVESVLVDNLSHSMGNSTPAADVNHRHASQSHHGHSFNMHHLFEAMKRYKSPFHHENHDFNGHHNHHHPHHHEEFSGHVVLTTHHTGLLLSLPNTPKPAKTVHFLVGKQEDEMTNHHPVRKRGRIFSHHTMGTTSKSHAFEKTSDEADVMDFPLRRSISLGRLMDGTNKWMDVAIQHSESSHMEVFGGHEKKNKIMRRVSRRLNLSDMHWITKKKHSTSSRVSLKSVSSCETTSGGEMTLMSSSLKIQTDVSR